MTTIETDGGFVRLTGTEADVAKLLARRQQLGLAKYGVSVRDNPLSLRQWARHALEESLDFCVYLQRTLEELDRLEDDGK